MYIAFKELKLSFFIMMLTFLVACGGSNSSNSPQSIDTNPPIITLNGDSSVSLFLNETYNELGASATDDSDVTVNVVITGSVDINTLGSYSITYSATDTAGNSSSIMRSVEVLLPPDTTPPTITLNGDNNITLVINENYNELGASATDDRDAIVDVVITGSVDISTFGSYSITYSATDTAGNMSSISRTVAVILPSDKTPPIIILNGASNITLIINEDYDELGANATDDRDGTLAVIITGFVDSSIIGSYIVTYSATDEANNSASVTRMVDVITPKPFITTWKTDNQGSHADLWGWSNDHQIEISTNTKDYDYDYKVDWGDGTYDEHVTGDITHTYAIVGIYTIKISGVFPQTYFVPPVDDGEGLLIFSDDSVKLLTVEQWGDNKWQSMHRAFANCEFLVVNANDTPDLSEVTDMSYMFSNSANFIQNISRWDISNVTNMSYMFVATKNLIQDINSWDVSNVTDMSSMFRSSDFNQNISNWNVSNVTDMSNMFTLVTAFEQDINEWDVSNVTDMSGMFSYSGFDQNISNWNVSNVIDMSDMFVGATAFEQNINEWDVSSVIYMNSMFSDSVFNEDISSWNVLSVNNMDNMFSDSVFNQDISSWDVSSVNDMSEMFENSTFNQDISNWDVSSVNDMNDMFAKSVFNRSIDNWDVSNVKSMWNMFESSAFNQNIGNWDVSNVEDMRNIFKGGRLSTSNYDALLMGWSRLVLKIGITFNAGNSYYSSGVQGYRDILTNNFAWEITDSGVN